MTDEEKEAAFQSLLERQAAYVDEVHDAGDLMWFERGGESPDEQLQLRRDLYFRRYR